jgi:predicted ATPase
VGGCTPDGQQTPFLPFVDVVRTFFLISQKDSVSEISRKLEKGLTALALNSQLNLNLLLNLLGLKTIGDALKGLDGVLIGLRTRDLLLLLLESHCRTMPVVVLLEDLHWTDRVTEELLARISGIEHELALLVVHTHRPEYRPSWTQNPSAETIALSPLSEAETSRIIQLRLGVSDLPGNLSSLITGKAEGIRLSPKKLRLSSSSAE